MQSFRCAVAVVWLFSFKYFVAYNIRPVFHLVSSFFWIPQCNLSILEEACKMNITHLIPSIFDTYWTVSYYLTWNWLEETAATITLIQLSYYNICSRTASVTAVQRTSQCMYSSYSPWCTNAQAHTYKACQVLLHHLQEPIILKDEWIYGVWTEQVVQFILSKKKKE